MWPLAGMTFGITRSVKTAISVDDSLMAQADDAARDLGMSRSGLIAEALRQYLKRRHQSRITEQLDRAYASGSTSAEKERVKNLKKKLPVKDRW